MLASPFFPWMNIFLSMGGFSPETELVSFTLDVISIFVIKKKYF